MGAGADRLGEAMGHTIRIIRAARGVLNSIQDESEDTITISRSAFNKLRHEIKQLDKLRQ